MGLASVIFAVFTVGYIVGVWTACLVFRKPQREYEESATRVPSGRRVIRLAAAPVPLDRWR